MIIDYNDCFWHDSILEKIEIVYDKINITTSNNVWQNNKKFLIECINCVGITQLNTWDEIVIHDIFLNKISDGNHTLIRDLKEVYGEGVPCSKDKGTDGDFFELKIVMVGDGSLQFSVVCRKIVFRDEY